jgi:hypothetical protein
MIVSYRERRLSISLKYMEHLPKLMAMSDVRKCLGGLSAQRVHELIHKKKHQLAESFLQVRS